MDLHNICPTKEENVYVDLSQVATCPFDRSHVMKKSRLQYHIVSCMKKYKGTKVPCPYDHTEYIEPEDLYWHLGVCESRKSVEVHRFNSNKNRNIAIQHNRTLHSAPVQTDDRHSEENWGFD
ncbi:hypothetical protein GE061_010544 [Apolygus lucorum]|uniref:CHHC U11-48K-type domain-containing protein n=1 Tax=Apolygus lucorum TaxID=248454 RepID=A0A6A4K036_APOLU|nr:hypothetical protein GE061_010544 [Apolygus lucorum]